MTVVIDAETVLAAYKNAYMVRLIIGVDAPAHRREKYYNNVAPFISKPFMLPGKITGAEKGDLRKS